MPYLAVFREVCEEGGFSAAARKLNCSQPAVSYQIERLEEAVGFALLERAGRRVILTPEGRRLRSFVERVFEELAQVRTECVAGQRAQPLRLGSASGFGRYVLFPALLRLYRELADHERPELRLQYDAADAVLEQLEAGAFEAAFVYKRKVSNALVYETVYEEELVLIANQECGARAVALGIDRRETLDVTPFITYEECDYVFGRWFDTCFGAQPRRLDSRAHFTELEEVLDCVARGFGVSVVPRDAVEGSIGRREIEVLRAGTGQRCLNAVFRAMRAGSEPRPLLTRVTEVLRRGPGSHDSH